jgi:hypothetical protein
MIPKVPVGVAPPHWGYETSYPVWPLMYGSVAAAAVMGEARIAIKARNRYKGGRMTLARGRR